MAEAVQQLPSQMVEGKPTADQSPYVGPRPFERADASKFFGRDAEANALISLTLSHPAVLLFAQSGAGKTSMINAQVVPVLEERGCRVLANMRVSGSGTHRAGANHFIANAIDHAWSELPKDGSLPDRAGLMTLAEFLAALPPATDEDGLPAPSVLIFDQFEEIFTWDQDKWREREGFFREVGDALDADKLLRVIFAMREEYIAELAPYLHLLPERLRTVQRLERLREGAAMEAVNRPLEGTGIRFAPGVAESLVQNLLRVPIKSATGTTDVSGEFVEPVQLQVVCRKLWEKRPEGVTEITGQLFREFGDPDTALIAYYEEALERASAVSGVSFPTLRNWFTEKLITRDGTRGTVFQEAADTAGLANTAVAELERLRLVRAEVRGGARWIELTHDRFIGPIRESNKKWKRELEQKNSLGRLWEQKAAAWAQARDSDAQPTDLEKLLVGRADEINAVEQWLASPVATALGHSSVLDEYVQACRVFAERRKFYMAVGVAAMAVMFAGMAIFALYSANTARTEAIKANKAAEESTRLAREAAAATLVALREERGKLAQQTARENGREFDALVYGIQAVADGDVGVAPTEAVKGLIAGLNAVDTWTWIRGIEDPARKILLSRDGSRALVLSGSLATAADARTGETLWRKTSELGNWQDAAFVGGGARVALIQAPGRTFGNNANQMVQWSPPEASGGLAIFDAKTGASLEDASNQFARRDVAFCSDDRFATVRWGNGGTGVYELATGTCVVSVTDQVQDIVTTADGRFAGVISRSGTLRLADFQKKVVTATFEHQPRRTDSDFAAATTWQSVAISSDGSRLAAITRPSERTASSTVIVFGKDPAGSTNREFSLGRAVILASSWVGDTFCVVGDLQQKDLGNAMMPAVRFYRMPDAVLEKETETIWPEGAHVTPEGRIVVYGAGNEVGGAAVAMIDVAGQKIDVFQATNGGRMLDSTTDASGKSLMCVHSQKGIYVAQDWRGDPQYRGGGYQSNLEALSPQELLDLACKRIRYQPEIQLVSKYCPPVSPGR
ncbi:MAG: hypothetical protein JSR77_12165 [Planctomycetes bacterium]|nr:hypothetical protein [Planctomycetota bacterium]